MKGWRRFGRAERGNVGVLFAFAVFGLVIAAGLAFDYGRLIKARSALQAAADSAALAAGAMTSPNQDAIKSYAQNYLTANHYDGVVDSIDDVTIDTDPATNAVTVHVQGELATSFMSLAGYQTMEVDAYSKAVGGTTTAPLELALVLDTTGSMAGSKIDTLKTAAKQLAAQVLAGSSDSKVGIVPFSNAVNVGTSHRGESWLNVPADYTDQNCWNSYPNATGCSTTSATSTCYNDGLPYSCTNYSTSCTSWGQPVTNCSPNTHTWNGCVNSRQPPLDTTIASPDQPYYGPLDTTCASPLTDLTSASSDVNAAIDSLTASGDTYIPDGILFGWHILDPAVPFTKAMSDADIAAKGGKKALVLMTDGYNTLAADPADSKGYHDQCTPNCSVADNVMMQLCSNVKSAGITVYTVLFDVTDPNIQNLLSQCASDPGKSFIAADNVALLTAFQKIGKSLGDLRLAK